MPTQCSHMFWLCRYTQYSTVTSTLLGFAVLNSFWVGILFVSQVFQVCVGKTTNENSNGHRYEYMTHPDDRGLPAYKHRRYNPFDNGSIANCAAFWREGVDWANVREVEGVMKRSAAASRCGHHDEA